MLDCKIKIKKKKLKNRSVRERLLSIVPFISIISSRRFLIKPETEYTGNYYFFKKSYLLLIRYFKIMPIFKNSDKLY